MKNTLKSVRTLAATLITFGSLAGGANAALVINFSDAGGGAMGYSITGTFTAINSAPDLGNHFADVIWQDVGDYKDDSQNETFATFPSVAIFTNLSGGANVRLDAFYLDNDGGGVSDDFGLNWTGSFVAGDDYSISSSGTLTLPAGQSFANYTVGALNLTNPLLEYGTTPINANDITVTIGAIPEPSSALLLGLGGLGLAARRKRIR